MAKNKKLRKTHHRTVGFQQITPTKSKERDHNGIFAQMTPRNGRWKKKKRKKRAKPPQKPLTTQFDSPDDEVPTTGSPFRHP